MAEPMPTDRSRPQPVPLIPLRDRDRIDAPIPPSLTSFVGRAREVEAISDLLRQKDVRLVSLIGPGGVGKTRLAIEVAASLRDAFADGTAYVVLAPIHDTELVVPTLARSLGLPEARGRSPLDVLTERMRAQDLLLVLDNFEQVVGAGPLLGRLLVACPLLKILVTSRVRLRVSGERAILVPPLTLAEGKVAPSLSAIASAEASRLFVERAATADPTFALTDDNAAAVSEICARLDGLPLAIELAAARVPILPPVALLARLTQEASGRLAVLAAGPRDVPARQRTLRAAIAWSHDLLSADEQRLFRRLAVFVGGFTIDAAEAVSASPSAPPPHRPTALEGIAALVDASLLRREEGPGGEPRYRMLETVRDFGLVALAAEGEEEAVRTAHAAVCSAFAERDQRAMAWPEMAAWFDRLEAEHDNLRAALAWLERSGNIVGLLRLAGNLAWFWLYRSHRAEGRRCLEHALRAAQAAEVPDGVRAWALHGAALLTRTQNDAARAEQLAEEGLRLYRGLGDTWGTAVSLNLLGSLARSRGDLAAARAAGEEALPLFEELQMARWVARVRAHLGIVAHWRGDDVAAQQFLDAALEAHRALNDQIGVAIASHWRAAVASAQGDLTQAASLEREGLAAANAAGAKEALLDGLAGLATIAADRDRMEEAARLLGAVGAHRERLGYTFERPEHERYDRVYRIAREALGDAAFARAEATGRALSLEEAVAEATAPTTAEPAAAPVATDTAARHGLTAREVEVLRLLAQRRTDREIADELFISAKTAGFHVANILGKLGVANRREAAALAIREGLTPAPS